MDSQAYEVTTTTTSTGDPAALIGFLVIYFALILLIAVPSFIIMWKLFKKAGYPGWASIVPVYNVIVMTQIAKLSLVWALAALFVPFVAIYVTYKMLQQYGKGFGYTLFVSFLPLFAMFTVGKLVYQGNNNVATGPEAAAAPVADTPAESFTPAPSTSPVTPEQSPTPSQYETQPTAPVIAPVQGEESPSTQDTDVQNPPSSQNPPTSPTVQ